MRILLLNGNPDAGPEGAAFEGWLGTFKDALDRGVAARGDGSALDCQAVRELEVGHCSGCWSCWWATPGRCAKRDAMEGMYPRMLAADALVFAFPLVLGATPAIVKRYQDRSIPLIHPYMAISRGELHHRRRYDWRPKLSAVVGRGAGDTDGDVALAGDLIRRFSINLRGSFGSFITTAVECEEAARAILSA